MNSSDEDEFEFDFVSNASKKVQSYWAKDFNREKSESRRSAERVKAAEEQDEVGCKKSEINETLTTSQTSPVKAVNANSLGKSEETKMVDSPVEITPPGSPTGGTPLSARTVRGAKRTKKTEKALKELKKTTAVSSGRLPVRESARLEDGGLLSSDEEDGDGEVSKEDTIEVKVVWKGKVERVTVGWAERMGQVMDRVARMVGVPSSSLLLYRDEELLGREETVGGLGLSVASVLQGRSRVAVEGETPWGGIELRLQTKDRRSQAVLITVFPNEQMKEVMDKYVMKSGVDREKVKFFFDGEEIEENQTAEELEMEGGECIDVHIQA